MNFLPVIKGRYLHENRYTRLFSAWTGESDDSTIATHIKNIRAKELAPILASTPDFYDVQIPAGIKYALFDKNYRLIDAALDENDLEQAKRYATTGAGDRTLKKGYLFVTRENEYVLLQYYIGAQYTNEWINKHLPSPDILLIVLISFSRMKESLKASLEQQWKAEQMQKEQIAALAHDLKTPLTVIQGNTDLIRETKLDEEQRLYAEYISSSSEQMQLYIRTLIDISRAAAGYQLHIENISLSVFVEQLRGQVSALCQTKKVGLQMESDHLPVALSADKLLVERAIMNVVNNALDYCPQDSFIHISVTGDKDNLKITVTDAGPGFSQEDLLHAQEQFYMAAHSKQFRKGWRRTGYNFTSILTS